MTMTDDQLMAAEQALETDSVEDGQQRYRALLTARGGENSSPAQALMRRSIDRVVEGINEWQKQAADGTPGRAVGLAKFVAQFDADEVAFTALRHIVRAIHRADQKLTATAMAVVADLEAVNLEARLKKADPQLFKRYVRVVSRRSRQDKRKISILRSQGEYLGIFSAKANFEWSASEKVQVGLRLLEIVRERTEIVDWQLANDLAGSGQREKNASYYILPTERASEWLKEAHASMELARPIFYPMVVPPRDWIDNAQGGYLSDGRGFRRAMVKGAFGNFSCEVDAASMPLVTEAVNALQRVPFAVNLRVLEVAEANAAHGSISGLPSSEELRPLPPRLEFMDQVPSEDWTASQVEDFKAWKRATAEAKEHNGRAIADKRTTQTTLEIARKMLPYPAIYFPVTLDFRGRAYPIPSYLQPQGADLAKGLLRFAKAAPLGPDGMRWLAVHVANCFGGDTKLDKQAYDSRVRWVRENHEQIVADAEDPHRPHALWPTADAPFQFLAGCFEWRDMALHAARTGTVETFESHLPVGLDGSCNGLQHYSAMLRDPIGGAATNLIPSDKPADIYSLVADEVRKLIELDLASDDEEVREFARFWTTKGITRRWTKRNTMTLPYGVTRQGMKDQIWAEIGRGAHREFFEGWEVNHGKCIGYLSEKNWEAIGSVVVAARSAMQFLQQCAAALTAAKMPVRWTTVDGLPVYQSYRMSEEVAVQMFGAKIKLILRRHTHQIHSAKQKLALAPNFVHSIDAAHMRAVTRRLVREGITSMSMVHDSFAVHAGHVTALASVIRREFAALHEQPLLDIFLDGISPGLSVDYPAPAVPPAGSLDLSQVVHSDYFFA
jgi:DNA-directed RNA polymerase